MELYIQAASIISPQKTFGEPAFPSERIFATGDQMPCIEPDYTKLIDQKSMRRMSRIIRMGVAAAMACLQEAGINSPDAIITGTAYGCLEDTEIFLKKLVENNEELLTPTAFIQSTHNTVGAQIALLLQCHKYNNTHVHRGFSFENALLDAMLLLQEREANHVLVGGVDEITKISHAILARFGLYKRHRLNEEKVFLKEAAAAVAGEGAGFFLLTSEESNQNIARLDGLSTFYKTTTIEEIEKHLQSFLEYQSLQVGDIDLVITGENGSRETDQGFHALQRNLFSQNTLVSYKDLCGEYPTSSAFALWYASRIIKKGSLPIWANRNHPSPPKEIRRILIYNNYYQLHHSLYLVSAC